LGGIGHRSKEESILLRLVSIRGKSTANAGKNQERKKKTEWGGGGNQHAFIPASNEKENRGKRKAFSFSTQEKEKEIAAPKVRPRKGKENKESLAHRKGGTYIVWKNGRRRTIEVEVLIHVMGGESGR